MKRVKYYIAAVTLLLLMVISSAAKQPPPDLGYEPPAGWEFVMKLDSASTFNLHCHSDTCFLASYFSGDKPSFYKITTNGGETWESIPTIPGPRTFMINSNTLHRLDSDSIDYYQFYYEKSEDFYKTSHRYFIEKIDGYAIDTLYQSPIEPNLLIATFIRRIIFEDYSIANSIVRISFDGGIKWESLPNLYKHPTNKSIYKFVFDWAEKGHWFVKVIDGSYLIGDDFSMNLAPVFLETSDNGKNYREIKFDPINQNPLYYYEYGLDGKNKLRELNKYNATGIDIMDYKDTIISKDFKNWLYLMDPSKPMNNIDSGYARSFGFIDGYYHYDFSNYKNVIIPVNERIGDINNNDYTIDYYLYHTTDNGKTWELKNHLDKKPYFYDSFLDQGTKTLWIYVKDDAWKNGTEMYKGSLWKLKLPWETTSVENIENKDRINISPNPAGDFITISLESLSSPSSWTPSNIEIFDMLGVKVISEPIHPLTSSQQMNIENLSAGVYFIKIGDKVEKFVKM